MKGQDGQRAREPIEKKMEAKAKGLFPPKKYKKVLDPSIIKNPAYETFLLVLISHAYTEWARNKS